MPKEKNYNPVQAQRKADKAKAIRKGKAENQERRNERLARKNPDRIQKHIDDLKAAASNGGKLTRNEEQVLAGLEKELAAVQKAREAAGDSAPTFSRRREGSADRGVLGKRRRGSRDGSSSDEEVTEDVRAIPMPRDTPPPIPKDVLDQWYAKRRARRQAEMAERGDGRLGREQAGNNKGGAANVPAVESKTVYEAKPVMRDLRQEAVAAFVPAAVQVKMMKGRGQGGLMEPEEADQLEREGYLNSAATEEATERPTEEGDDAGAGPNPSRVATVEDAADEG
ncbi:hypothetical protein RJ55_06060 [Drechmeria coniospora]|nr:hypothetical protein RJ55_06060 [Drechmeria coniospora]